LHLVKKIKIDPACWCHLPWRSQTRLVWLALSRMSAWQ